MRSKLEIAFISISLISTLILFIVIGSLFVIINPADILESLFSPEMIFALELTLITSSVAAICVMLVAIPTSYALSRYKFPLKSIFKSILSLPMALPEIVVGIALLMLLGDNLLGGALEKLGINIIFTTTGIIIAQICVAFPYAVRILYSTFNYVNPRYEFVSRSLGYSELETFQEITLPLAKNGIFASSIVTLARCIGTFAAVLFVGGGTFMKTETLSIALYLNMSFGNVNMAITAGIVLVVISFIAILVMERYAQEKYL